MTLEGEGTFEHVCLRDDEYVSSERASEVWGHTVCRVERGIGHFDLEFTRTRVGRRDIVDARCS